MEWSPAARKLDIPSFDQKTTQNKVGEVVTFLRQARR
jgi:hypothetical protein